MIFEFVPMEGLPKLAWCAVLQPEHHIVQILHGPWIETNAKFFVDGAWDGEYVDGRFDNAITFTGSGGLICDQGVVFATPTHNLERLFSLRKKGSLFISNSLVFLLTHTKENLDLKHPNYFFDVLNHYRHGLTTRNKTLRTNSDHSVECHECTNLLIGQNLQIDRIEKDFGPTPENYSEYVCFLDSTVSSVIINAQHPARCRKFPPITAISRGYDSTAISVLAAKNGCTDAVSFTWGGDRAGTIVEDDGMEAASYLGLDVSLYDKRDYQNQTHSTPAELFTNPYQTTERATQLMEQQVAGRIFLSGRHGEHFWETDPVRAMPWFQEPTTLSMAGANSSEMRLRMGYFNYPAPYTLGVYSPDLLKISCSNEMRPWRIGGNYDRPIPRRLLEEAGIPRKLFGQTKIGGIGPSPEFRVFNAKWEQEFLSFYNSRVDVEIRNMLFDKQAGKVPFSEKGKMGGFERRLRTQRGLRGPLRYFPTDHRHHRWRSKYLYTFHWGFEHTAQRYKSALSKQETK